MPFTIQVYSDLNPDYDVRQNEGERVYDFEAILSSIRTILSVRVGEMFFLYDFGANIEDQLFEQMDAISTQQLYGLLISSIERWEPRVRVNRSATRVTPIPEKQAYDIFLVLEVVGLSTPRKEISFRIVRELGGG